MRTVFFCLLSMVCCLWSSPSSAGGPWKVDTVNNSGTPARWPYNSATGKWEIHWRADPGYFLKGSKQITSAQAVEGWIKPMLADWQNVKLPFKVGENPVVTVAIEFIYDGPLVGLKDNDITVENYYPFAFNPDPAKPTPTTVIFDPDGSIIKDYCLKQGDSEEVCEAEKNVIAGRAEPFPDSQFKLIHNGFIILNGWVLDKQIATEDMYKAIIKHEFGHLVNLDHSQVNMEIVANCKSDNCEGAAAIGTMLPKAITPEQYTLHVDDKVAISWLYPAQAFKDNFCVIVGEVQDENEKGLQGVNVVARSMNDPNIDARSMVSGALYGEGAENGKYFLSGLMPQVDYEVSYEEIMKEPNETRGSGIGPVSLAPAGFGTGIIQGPEKKAAVHCNQGGEVIEMETLKLSLADGRALSGAVSGEEKGASGKKGWCQLINIKNQKSNSKYFIFGFLSLALILFVFRLHFKGGR